MVERSKLGDVSFRVSPSIVFLVDTFFESQIPSRVLGTISSSSSVLQIGDAMILCYYCSNIPFKGVFD